jgi:hypothetical protein
MTLYHALHFIEFGVGILIRGGDEHRIAALLGHRGHCVSAVGKERIIKIGDDEADGARALTAKGARQLVGPVLQLADRQRLAGSG